MIDDENINPQGITAYHGSPHKFDQFDTSKIGTGEGNQSYGHGLYFAEHEPVAKKYRDNLSNYISDEMLQTYFKPGSIVPSYGGMQKILNYEPEKRLVTAQGINPQGNFSGPIRRHGTMPDLKTLNEEFKRRGLDPYVPGHMYEVAIDAHPDHMLDWDKPLSEQHPNVQKFLSKSPYPPKEDQSIGAWLKPLLRDSQGMPEYWSYDMLKAGIPGIRYLDAGSRNAQGDPTHNYVVFDHNRVKIKRRYKKGGRIDAYGDYIERTKRATGGRIPHADKLFNEAKKTLDNQTKPMLNVHDDAIVHALRIAQGRV